MSVTAVSLERWWAVARPLVARQWQSRDAGGAILAVTVVGLVANSWTLFISKNDPVNFDCVPARPTNSSNFYHATNIADLVLTFAIPAALITHRPHVGL